jgi:CBS domain-containing protein
MNMGQLCSRVVATAMENESVTRGAERMAEFDVGCLVVLDHEMHPVGIVTDRDVALRVIGRKLNPDETTLGDLMSTPVRTLREETDVNHALETMERHGIRRLVVTSNGNGLAGLVSLDDIQENLAQATAMAGRVLERQSRHAMALR